MELDFSEYGSVMERDRSSHRIENYEFLLESANRNLEHHIKAISILKELHPKVYDEVMTLFAEELGKDT